MPPTLGGSQSWTAVAVGGARKAAALQPRLCG